MTIIRYDDIFSWDGWGGKFKLTSGRCRLQIYDFQKSGKTDPIFLKSTLVIVSDLPEASKPLGVVSIHSCAGHIATLVIRQFQINPERMLYIEYHPEKIYGSPRTRRIPERYEAVDFKWHSEKAIAINWRILDPRMLEQVKGLTRDKQL
jgi:hypothetical protein